MSFEVVEYNGIRYAEIIEREFAWRRAFFFPRPSSRSSSGCQRMRQDSSRHPIPTRAVTRTVTDLQQMFVAQTRRRGCGVLQRRRGPLREVILRQGMRYYDRLILDFY